LPKSDRLLTLTEHKCRQLQYGMHDIASLSLDSARLPLAGNRLARDALAANAQPVYFTSTGGI